MMVFKLEFRAALHRRRDSINPRVFRVWNVFMVKRDCKNNREKNTKKKKTNTVNGHSIYGLFIPSINMQDADTNLYDLVTW